MVDYLVEICLALGDKFATLLNVRSDLGQDKLWIDLAVALNKCIAQLGGH